MTESIGIRITALCEDILPFYLSEAQQEDYPYAIYEQVNQEFYTKDGVYKITADVTIRVYSGDANEAMTKADALRSALDNGSNDQYVIRYQSSTTSCLENVWTVELQYLVKQLS